MRRFLRAYPKGHPTHVMPALHSLLQAVLQAEMLVCCSYLKDFHGNDLREVGKFLRHAGSDCDIANVNIGVSGAEIGGAFGMSRESGLDAWKARIRRQTATVNWSGEMPLAQRTEFAVK